MSGEVPSSDLADPSYEAKREFFRNAFRLLDFNRIPGDYCEFGCNTAATFRLAHEGLVQRDDPMGRHMWAFDSFAGLPPQRSEFDSHPVWVEGTLVTSLEDFRRLCGEYGIPAERYTCVPGFYEEALPRAAEPAEVALAHVDCDLYTSAGRGARLARAGAAASSSSRPAPCAVGGSAASCAPNAAVALP